MPDRIVELDYGAEKRETTYAEHELGDLGMLRDGRSFRYNFMDGAVTAGKLLQTPVTDAAHDMDLVTAVAAIGATSITVTLGAVVAAADLYKDGYIYTNDGTGEGQLFKIGPHAAWGSGGTVAVPIRDEGGVRTALDATTLCSLFRNPWKDTVVAPTTFTGSIVGATTVDRATDTYGWAQRTGQASLLIKGTVVRGERVRRGDATTTNIPGAVEAVTHSDDDEAEDVGTCSNIIAVDTDYGLISMSMAP